MNTITGTIIDIFATVEYTEKFSKREFVVEQTTSVNGTDYKDPILLQLVNAKCELLDNINIGQEVTVSYNLRGRRWEGKDGVRYFNSLDAWKIEQHVSHVSPVQDNEPSDGLPF